MPAGLLACSKKMLHCFPTLPNSKPLPDFKTGGQMFRSYKDMKNHQGWKVESQDHAGAGHNLCWEPGPQD